MNVAAHHEKEKNEKTCKREAENKRKQPTNFKEAACYPNAVVQRAVRQKNVVKKVSAQGNWDPRKGQQPFPLNLNGVGDRTTTFTRLLIGAEYQLFEK